MNEQSINFFRHLEDAVVKALEITDMSNPKRFFGCLMDIASVDPEISGAPEFSLLSCIGKPEFLSCFRMEEAEKAQRAAWQTERAEMGAKHTGNAEWIVQQTGEAAKTLTKDMNLMEVFAFSMVFVNASCRVQGLGQPFHIDIYQSEKKQETPVTIGQTFSFGSYPQTERGESRPIDWIVLRVEGKKALLISKYALDRKRYNEYFTDITWEKCTLRSWLNETFFDKAFLPEEQKRILTTTVSADRNPEYNTDPGKDTRDRVFLLSIQEAEELFASDEDRICKTTGYAARQGAWVDDRDFVRGAACWWWLRSPALLGSRAASVCDDGATFCRGNFVNDDIPAVRPALWINLE